MHTTIIFFISSLVIANPVLTDEINEFQTDTILGQKCEFHPIQYGFEIPLFNTRVITPAVVLMLIHQSLIHLMDTRS